MRAASKLRWAKPEEQAKIARANSQRQISLETRQKMSAARSGKPRSPEERLKIAIGHGARPFEDQDGNRYGSIRGAARDLGLNPTSISKVLLGSLKTTGGLSFRYVQ